MALAEWVQLLVSVSPAATDIFHLVSWPSKQNNSMTKSSRGRTKLSEFNLAASAPLTITGLLRQKICFCDSKSSKHGERCIKQAEQSCPHQLAAIGTETYPFCSLTQKRRRNREITRCKKRPRPTHTTTQWLSNWIRLKKCHVSVMPLPAAVSAKSLANTFRLAGKLNLILRWFRARSLSQGCTGKLLACSRFHLHSLRHTSSSDERRQLTWFATLSFNKSRCLNLTTRRCFEHKIKKEKNSGENSQWN